MAVDPNIKQKANNIRTKQFGSEVRESLATGLESMSEDVVDVKGRQLTVEGQFQTVIEETTGKDVISAPEIIAARGNHSNLSQRLLSQDEQLAEKIDKSANVKNTQDGKRKPLFVFVSDDGGIKDYADLQPLSVRYDIPFCVSLIGNVDYNLDGSLSRYKEMVRDYGWEILSHSQTHASLPGMSSELLVERELKQSYETLKAKGFDVKGIAYPYGHTSDTVQRIAKKYYHYGVGINHNGDVTAKKKINSDTFINDFNILRVAVGNNFDGVDNYLDGYPMTNTLAYYKKRVDEAITQNGLLVFMLHPNYASDPVQLGYLEELIQYVQVKDIEITTMTKALQVFGNAFQAGYNEGGRGFVVSKNGETNVQSVDKQNLYTFLTPPSGFPVKRVTGFHVDSVGNSGFPSSGFVTTIKADRTIYGVARQEFRTNANNDLWVRYEIPDDKWSEFVLISGTALLPLNLYNASTPPSQYKRQYITSFYVLTTNGFPVSGVLTTYKPDKTSDGVAKQLLFRHESDDIYSRYQIGDLWSEFTIVGGMSKPNAYPFSKKPSEFPANKITNFFVLSDQGYPSSGIVTVYKPSSPTFGSAKQEFRKHNTNEMWSRYETTGDTWTPFVKASVI